MESITVKFQNVKTSKFKGINYEQCYDSKSSADIEVTTSFDDVMTMAVICRKLAQQYRLDLHTWKSINLLISCI